MRRARSRPSPWRPGRLRARDRGIAPEPGRLGARQGAAPKPHTQLLVGHLEYPLGSGVWPRREERRLARGRRFPVPRTDALADVAAELPWAELAFERRVDGAAMLDGEIGDAAPRVEHIGRHEGLGGAGVETGATATAAIDQGVVEIERGRGQEGADEEPGAELGVEQHRVLADPAQAGPGRQVPFEDRPRVDVAFARGPARLGQM